MVFNRTRRRKAAVVQVKLSIDRKGHVGAFMTVAQMTFLALLFEEKG